ncbi:MAG: hypothetical protein HZB66_02150 [Candidatus Aenigmarchaeota archaeon]|nr:hypothetical protein [Candidatus Aenigmarchaeota archaeon]
MDAAIEVLSDVRRALSHQEEMIRSTRDRLNTEISLVRGKIYELNARVDSLLKSFRSDYTDAFVSRFEDMEEASDQILGKINGLGENLDLQLSEQNSKINSLYEDISLLQEEINSIKNRLSEISGRNSNFEILERIARLERESGEKEITSAVDKLRG